MSDYRLTNHGHLFSLKPTHAGAESWLRFKHPDPDRYMERSLILDSRNVAETVAVLIKEGFSVKMSK